MLPKKPYKNETRIKVNRWIPVDQMQEFFAKGFQTKTDQRYKLLCILAMTTGLRISELCAIHLDDFSNNTRTLKVRLAKTGDINERILPAFIPGLVLEHVKNHKYGIMLSNGWLFPAYTNKATHIQPKTAQIWLSKKRKELGGRFLETVYTIEYNTPRKFYNGNTNKQSLYKFAWHSFRRFFCTYLYKESQYDVKFVCDVIGHRNLQTTTIYLQSYLSQEQQHTILERIYNHDFQPIITNNPILPKNQTTINNY